MAPAQHFVPYSWHGLGQPHSECTRMRRQFPSRLLTASMKEGSTCQTKELETLYLIGVCRTFQIALQPVSLQLKGI